MTPWRVARQAPLSMGFSRQEYWSGLPFPSPGVRPNPETEPMSPALTGGFFATEPPVMPGNEIGGPDPTIGVLREEMWNRHMGNMAM